MKIPYYSLKDKKLGVFNIAFPAQEGLKKVLVDLERSVKSGEFKYPEDFELWQVGVFDNETALFDTADMPQKLAAFDDKGGVL